MKMELERESAKDIIKACAKDLSLNNAVCNNKDFWIKLARERLSDIPDVLEFLSKLDLAALKREVVNTDDIVEKTIKTLIIRVKYPLFYHSPWGAINSREDDDMITYHHFVEFIEKGYNQALLRIEKGALEALTKYPDAKREIRSYYRVILQRAERTFDTPFLRKARKIGLLSPDAINAYNANAKRYHKRPLD